MKKALLIFALVAFLATGTVFAELTGVGEPTVSGSVSTTFGYDLDSEASGFVNDSSLTLTLPLLDGDMTKGGDDGIYGEITVDGIGWQLTNDGWYDVDEDDDGDVFTDVMDASISAKLVINDLYVKLAEPDFTINNVDISDDYLVDANIWADDTPDLQGISVGFMNDLVTLEARIASYDDGYLSTDKDGEAGLDEPGMDHDTAFTNEMGDVENDDEYVTNVDNLYVFGAAVTLNPMEGVSVPITVTWDGNEELIGVGIAPSVTQGALTFDLPIDYVQTADASAVELWPSLTYDLVEGSSIGMNFLYGTYTDVVVNEYNYVGAVYVAGPDLPVENEVAEFGLSFVEEEENGFMPGMAATLDFALTDMMNYLDAADHEMGWDVDGTASYNMNGLKPYVGAGYGSNEVVDLNVGVEMAAAFTGFDNTVFTLDYAVDDLTDTNEANKSKGRVTFDATVSF